MAAASYWNCPICLRRVPERVSECYCGRKRQPDDGPEAPEAAGGRGALLAALVFVACAAAAYALLRRPEPAPPAPPPSVSAVETATPPPRFPGESARHPLPPPPLADPQRPATPGPAMSEAPSAAPKPSPTPSDSADALRERGMAAFDAAIKNLSGRLGALRREIAHYNQVCPREQTQVIGCDAARQEITDAAREIRAGLDAAEEGARRSWLDPGVQRAIRERSGMDDATVGETLSAAAGAGQR